MDGPAAVLFQYGLAGVVIFGQAIAIVTLYKDRQAAQQKYEDSLEARRLDAKESADKVVEPLKLISQTTSLIYDKMVVTKGKRS